VAARVMALADGRQTLLTRSAFDLARQSAATERFEVSGRLRWLAHGPYRLKGVAEPVEIFEVGVSGFAPLIVPKSTAKARRAVSAEEELTLGWRPAPGLEIPRRPKWFLTEKLGEGGFGEVWLGHHGKTHDARVFKFCYQADRLRSLQREVTLFRLLKETLGSRSDIARILDWNFEKAPYFLESEYTEGGNLLEWTAERGGADAVPRAQRLELIAQIADALSAAHSVGILHKDVKPSNVLITNGTSGNPQVRLTDFGIGVVTDRGVLAERGITLFELTEMVANGTSSAGGTHLYMAPELVEGRTPTVQADIYALGVMLYQFLVGDFSRALASGWRRDLDDEILIEDIASMVDGHPDRRLRDAREVAERLRTLEERRALRDAERREREERDAERRALERAQRRRKISALIAAAATVVLVVVSILAYQAIEARKEAERRRAQAENLIGFMVGDLREKLAPIGRLEILDEVGDQALAYFDAVPSNDLTNDEIFRRSQALYQIGEVRFASGNLREALQAYRDSLTNALSLPQGEAAKPEWLKGLGTSHFGVGYVRLRQGDLEGALESFQEYLHIAEELVAREPTELEWQLETAYALSNIGSVQQARGDLDEASESFSRSLAIRQMLVATDPSNIAWRRGLGVAHNKLGVVLNSLGRPREALKHFEEDLRISQNLAALAPLDTDLQHRVGVGHAYVAYILEALGRLDDAMEDLVLGRKSLLELTRRDPTNSGWLRDLAVVNRQIGSVELDKGNPRAALESFRSAHTMLQDLVEQNPTDSGWQMDLIHAELSVGRALLLLRDDRAARETLSRGIQRAMALGDQRAEDHSVMALAARGHLLLGVAHEHSGNRPRAEASWNRAVELLAPFIADARDRLVLETWSESLLRLGRREDAETQVRRLLDRGYYLPTIEALWAKNAPPPEEVETKPTQSGG